jgi:2-oxoglutarate ferredoxin oxidoreductase subunit alpha
VKAKLVSMRLLSPAQPEKLAKALEGVKKVLVVEQNHSGQFHRYLRADYNLPGEVRSLRQPGPLPMPSESIYRTLTEWSRS